MDLYIQKTVRIGGLVAAALYVANAMLHPDQPHVLDVVNLIFHEAGHTIFSFFGEFIHVLAGSAVQVLIPVACAFSFFIRSDWYAAGISLMWAGESCAGVAHYAADAVVQQLELLGGDNVIHDWNYLLSTLHLLPFTPYIAYTIYAAAIVLCITGAALALHEVLVGKQSERVVV